jgi:hypothetical protein
MIPEDYKDEIIAAGINFMNAVTRAYGTDEGLKLYDTIMASVDPDIKGQIFFSLITGIHGSSIILKGTQYGIGTLVQRIQAIKEVSDLSLLDAKEYAESVARAEPKSIPYHPSRMNLNAALKTLREVGFVV